MNEHGFDDLARFVARMKLAELERQHALLDAAYTEIEAVGDEAESAAAAACGLWDGLAALRVANRPLHPLLDDISMLRAMVDAGVDADDVGATWVTRLRREVAQGRARARVAHVFGRLLEEHTTASPESDDAAQADAALDAWVRAMHEPPKATAHQAVFDEIFGALDPEELGAVRAKIAQSCEHTEYFRDEMYHAFPGALTEVCGPEALDVARQVAADESSLRELTDAMSIMLEHLETWRWPDVVSHEARWTRHRWRIYPREALSDATFAELACGWALDAVLSSLGAAMDNRAQRLARLIELNAPQVIIDNERRMLAQTTSLTHAPNVVFDPLVEDATAPQRRGELRALRTRSERGSYDYDATLVKAASLVAAEVRIQRTARPDQPIYVIKTDIREFYASVEHAVVLDLLERVGVPTRWRDLVARFLAIAVEGRPAQRGLPMGHRPSRALGEMVLQFMDSYVTRCANVRIVRAVDDICILAADPTEALAGFQSATAFLAACGLAINAEKSGCLVVGGDAAALADAPQGSVSWGLLMLGSDGAWSVDRAAIDARIAHTKTRMEQAHGVLRRVEVYNDEARSLVAYLGLNFDFGDAHRGHVREAIAHFVRSIGVVATDSGAAWLRWPLTAGGLGLYDPFVDALAYELAHESHVLPEIPDLARDPEDEAREQWADIYAELVRDVLPRRPARGNPMDALVDDFVARNRELHGDASAGGLSPYWTWILHTYGPEILERFGTFRFLLTELVPLRLILRARR